MRTNIVIEDALIKKALRLSGVNTKREVVHLALLELVQNRERKDIRDLRGKVSFRDDYDYKSLRESQTP